MWSRFNVETDLKQVEAGDGRDSSKPRGGAKATGGGFLSFIFEILALFHHDLRPLMSLVRKVSQQPNRALNKMDR